MLSCHTHKVCVVFRFVQWYNSDEMVSDDKTLAQQFGSRVRVLRKKRGMTQEQFAEATELSVNFQLRRAEESHLHLPI
jgi:ribosome-binding protein aMBF1 (putative translation factor)